MDTTTEFVFFHLPPTVRPEDEGNEDGQKIQKIFQTAKSQEGYLWSAWGRTEEDENALIWVIGMPSTIPWSPISNSSSALTEWSNNTSSVSVDPLGPLSAADPEVTKLRTRLDPSLSSINGGMLSAPCVDITTLPFVSFDDTTTANNDGEKAKTLEVVSWMKRVVTQEIPESLRPTYYCLSRPESFPRLPSPDSPTGQTDMCFAVVGWQSRQQHYDIWKTQVFKDMIPAVRAKLLPYPPAVGMKHTPFTPL